MSLSGEEKLSSTATSSPSILLPRFMVLKSYKSFEYLTYQDDAARNKGFLQFSGDHYTSPKIKFQVEAATEPENKGLVHIRSCYNNKYWTRSAEDSKWIVSRADNKEEDKAKWSCTLFEPLPVPVHDDAVFLLFRLLHVGLQAYAMLFSQEPDYHACLSAKSTTTDDDGASDIFIVTDWESCTILPRYVAFKGINGKYLSPAAEDYLVFTSTDISDPSVRHEVITNGNHTHNGIDATGSILFKAHNGCFWSQVVWLQPLTNDVVWIIANCRDGELPNLDITPWFWPLKIEDNNTNIVAIRAVHRTQGSVRFFRYNREFKDRFTLDALSAVKDTHLVVEEPVIKRNVSVDFRFDDARIYNVTPLVVATQTTTNKTDAAVTATISLAHKYGKTSTWSNSLSIKSGVKTTFKTGIPCIVDGKIEASAEMSYTHNWGGSVTTEETVSYQVQVSVPPKSKIKVSLNAKQGTCNVPFSYTQTDTLPDGSQVTYDSHDGSYTAVDCFDFNSVAEPAEVYLV